MTELKDVSADRLFARIKHTLEQPVREHTREALPALAELERRWTGDVPRLAGTRPHLDPPAQVSPLVRRLERMEEDIRALRRAHSKHTHELRPFALNTLAPTPGVSAPSYSDLLAPTPGVVPVTPEDIADAVTHAVAVEHQIPLHVLCGGEAPEVLTTEQQDARSWKLLNDWLEEGFGTSVRLSGSRVRGRVSCWEGNASVYDSKHTGHVPGERFAPRTMSDALAHAAQWCQSDMADEVPPDLEADGEK